MKFSTLFRIYIGKLFRRDFSNLTKHTILIKHIKILFDYREDCFGVLIKVNLFFFKLRYYLKNI